jgi:hypothetical protein
MGRKIMKRMWAMLMAVVMLAASGILPQNVQAEETNTGYIKSVVFEEDGETIYDINTKIHFVAEIDNLPEDAELFFEFYKKDDATAIYGSYVYEESVDGTTYYLESRCPAAFGEYVRTVLKITVQDENNVVRTIDKYEVDCNLTIAGIPATIEASAESVMLQDSSDSYNITLTMSIIGDWDIDWAEDVDIWYREVYCNSEDSSRYIDVIWEYSEEAEAYVAEFTVDKYTRPGIWNPMDTIGARVGEGADTHYFELEITNTSSLSVENDYYDFEPPVIKSIEVTCNGESLVGQTLNGDETIVVTAVVEENDELRDSNYVTCSFLTPTMYDTQQGYCSFSIRMSNQGDNTYVGTYSLSDISYDEEVKSTEWHLESISAIDKSGNTTNMGNFRYLYPYYFYIGIEPNTEREFSNVNLTFLDGKGNTIKKFEKTVTDRCTLKTLLGDEYPEIDQNGFLGWKMTCIPAGLFSVTGADDYLWGEDTPLVFVDYSWLYNITFTAVYDKDDSAELIDEIEAAEEGATITAEVQADILSQDVLEALKGKDVTLEVATDSGMTWKINGSSITSETALQDIDLSIQKTTKENGNISAGTIEALAGSRNTEQLIFGRTGDLGFMGNLTLDVADDVADDAKANKGVLVQLVDGNLVRASVSLIDDNAVTFTVGTGADSVVVYGTNGDTSGDGKVELADLMQLLHHVSERTKLNEVNQGFADVNMDNAVNMQDLMRELHYVSGRNSTL